MLNNFTRIIPRGIVIAVLFLPFCLQARIWTPMGRDRMESGFPSYIRPSKAATYLLNLDSLRSQLLTAPEEQAGMQVKTYGKIFSFPMPDGTTQRFAMVRYHMMEPGLRDVWSFAHTWLGQGIDDPAATVHADITAQGFHYQVLSPRGNAYADPVFLGDTRYYQMYRKDDLDPASKGPFREEFVPGDEGEPHVDGHSGPGVPEVLANGDTRRQYRMAIACTGEYAAFHGGANGAASAIVTSLNRVNGLYEKDLSIRMILIANNNLLIYTNATSDPYTNNSGSTMLNQNQSTITAVIGAAAYDIGHVFSTGGGGIARFASVCGSNKAMGVTGSNSPVGDPFDIDYVAHEVGHQFGGSHTFNSVTGSCGGGNRSADSAYEVGSGTTIMAYAGICGSDNTQNNSNDYFNFRSLDQILTFSQSGAGNTCAAKIPTGNQPPVVPAQATGFTIPINTPFRLRSLPATDVNSDTLTYCWEQSDLGPGGAPSAARGNAPLFRSFSPVSSPERVFPRWSNLLANSTNIGERLPSYARNMTFRLTVRDNNTGAGGVSFQNVSLSVNQTGGAFQVSAPNTSTVSWEAGTTQTVTWTPGSTASAPFNSPLVRIRLSTDGGNTWPILVKDSVANDGSESITVPVVASTNCRIMVESVSNIFFDISNANFRITAPTSASIPMGVPAGALCASQSLKIAISPTGTSYQAGNIFRVQLSSANGLFTSPTEIGSLNSNLSAGTDSIPVTLPATASGTGYKIRVVTTNPVRTSSQVQDLPLIRPLPAAPAAITGPPTLCSGDSVAVFTVSPVAGTTYEWALPTGSQVLSNPDSNAIRIRFGGTQGQVSLRLRNSCGLGPATNFLVSPIVVLPALVTATASSATPCAGSTLTLNTNVTNGGLSPQFRWLRNDTLIAGATGSTFQTQAQGTGVKYRAVLISSLFCNTPNIDTSNVLTINAQLPRTPTAAIASNVPNDTSCSGEAITFTSSVFLGGGTIPQYAWFRNLTQIAGQTGNSLLVSTLSSGDSVRLRLTVTGTCLTTNQVFSKGIRTTIINLTASAGADTVVCPADSLFLTGTPPGGTWSGAGVSNGNEFNPQGPANATLTYTVSAFGCVRTDTRVVNVPSVPAVTLAAGETNQIVASPASGATGWVWFKDGAIIPGASGPVLTYTEDGLYCAEAAFGPCRVRSACVLFTFTSALSRLAEQTGIRVYPNPVRDVLRVESRRRLSALVLTNSLGQCLIRQIDPLPESELNMMGLPAGLYFAEATGVDGDRIRIPVIRE